MMDRNAVGFYWFLSLLYRVLSIGFSAGLSIISGNNQIERLSKKRVKLLLWLVYCAASWWPCTKTGLSFLTNPLSFGGFGFLILSELEDLLHAKASCTRLDSSKFVIQLDPKNKEVFQNRVWKFYFFPRYLKVNISWYFKRMYWIFNSFQNLP